MLELSDLQQLGDQKLQAQLNAINATIAAHPPQLQAEIVTISKMIASGQDLSAAQKATFCTYWPTIKQIVDFLSQILTLFSFAKTWGPYIALLETFANQYCSPNPPVPPLP